jgi:molecular chaperone GrpE
MTDTHRANANGEPDMVEPNRVEPNRVEPNRVEPNKVEPAAADPAPAEDPAVALAREAAELKDKLLRTLAEMENLRARTARDVADSRVYAVSSFARDILGIADNLARALQTVRAGVRENADGSVKSLLDGVELTERELLKVLEKHGVRKFEPQPGEKFDPNLHQAMYEVADPALPSGTVAQVVQAGYMIGERMLRPALVAVAKSPPKSPPKPPPTSPPKSAPAPEPTANDTANDNASAGSDPLNN